MNDYNIRLNLRKILREDIVSQAENSVYKSLEPLSNIAEVETEMVNEKLPFPRIVEKLPKNPKKSFIVYNNVYKTLKDGALKPEELKKLWTKHSSTKTITMFVRDIAKEIHKYYGNDTTELLK